MDRRKFLSLMPTTVAAAKAAATTMAEAPVPSLRKGSKHPNVIVLICDDLGFGDLGCYGSRLPTPNLDRMASQGVHFTRFNAAHPICSASRAALLTGRYGHRSGTSGAFGPEHKTGTSLDETFLSNLFHDAGYQTKAIGKWHLGHMPPYLPTSRGFDSFYGVPYSVDMYPMPLMRDTAILEPEADRELLTSRFTEEAVSFIANSGEKPFFLYFGYPYPHDPPVASARFKGKSGLGDHGDSIAEIDWSVGEILRAVDRKGIAEDTLILFTSDHGPWYQGSPGRLRGRKASTFEGGHRVPLIARWTSVIAPGRVAETPCTNLDVLPTLAKICSLTPPAKPLDGTDISTLLLTGNPKIETKSQLYFLAMVSPGLDVHCIRKGDWKLRIAQGIKGDIYINDRFTAARESALLPHPELFNLALDPEESYDVAKFHPDTVAQLKSELVALLQTFPPNVQQAYAKLKQNVGDDSTPAGASPRPRGSTTPSK